MAQVEQDSASINVTYTGAHVDSLFYAPGDTLHLRPFIISDFVEIITNDQPLSRDQYLLNYRYGHLSLVDSSYSGLVIARYRTFPVEFKEFYQRRVARTLDSITDSSEIVQQFAEQAQLEDRATVDPFGSSRVQRSGSITRGVVVGNNRDLTVESGLRMQLSGEIVDGVQVQAVLTDENTPIQPEGTTQRLNDFDRVFIELAARQGTVQLGDFDLNFQGSEFAQFTRKLQGLRVFSNMKSSALDAGTHQPGLSVDVAGATARGIFRTQEIEPIDGVQGPYRLEGGSGEQFIIIVAGSEVVYLDGVQMTRGESNDYVIDYATGEITFTPNRIITDDRRISAEFQYTTNQFSRSLTGASVATHFWRGDTGVPRTTLGFTFLREADGDLFNDEFGLSGADSLNLIQVGDGLAQSSGAILVEFDPEAPYVHYVQEIVESQTGVSDTIFVAIDTRPADSVDVYRVQFTRIGSGQGSYVRNGLQINGILFEYRGPGRGDYEPVRVLPKPVNHNVIDFNGTIEPIKGIQLFGEWARSFNDENRFSSKDSQDDIDHAYKGGIRVNKIPLLFGFEEKGYLELEALRRQIGSDFESFNRIRPVEFGRRWNINSSALGVGINPNETGDEVVEEIRGRLYLNPSLFVGGEVGRIDLDNLFAGSRSMIEAGVYNRLDYVVEWISSSDNRLNEDGEWIRQRGRLSQPTLKGRFVPYVEFEQERREQTVIGTDSLTRASNSFTEIRPGMVWNSTGFDASFQLELREEKDWAEGRLRDAARARTYQSAFNVRPNNTFNTDGSVGYRVKDYTEYFRLNERREDVESLLLRWNTQWRPLKRAIDLTTRYEAATERTPTLQEIYIRTGPELGQFVWEDTNEDGAIQIDEFLPERTPNEGTYIQTFVPSDSLSSIISVRALFRMQLDPSKLIEKDATGIKRILRQITTRTTVDIQEKSREDDLESIYLLKLSRFRSPLNTLNGRLRINQDIYLFRSVPKMGIDIQFNQLRSLSELTAGEETRFLNAWSVEGRFAPSRAWGLRLKGETETSRLNSETFASRRYNISGIRLEPEVSYAISASLSVTAKGIWARKSDRVGDREVTLWRMPLELRYRRLRRAQITARGEVAIINLSGDALGLAAFELTDGRGAGTSYLWGVLGEFTLNQYLRFSLAYDGRAPADAPILHTMRMQLSALF